MRTSIYHKKTDKLTMQLGGIPRHHVVGLPTKPTKPIEIKQNIREELKLKLIGKSMKLIM
jgi:hypothetical protein